MVRRMPPWAEVWRFLRTEGAGCHAGRLLGEAAGRRPACPSSAGEGEETCSAGAVEGSSAAVEELGTAGSGFRAVVGRTWSGSRAERSAEEDSSSGDLGGGLSMVCGQGCGQESLKSEEDAYLSNPAHRGELLAMVSIAIWSMEG